MKGNLKGILGQTGMGLKNALFSQVDRGSQMLFQVAAIGLIGAVFTNVSSVFKGGQISDTGFSLHISCCLHVWQPAFPPVCRWRPR